MDIQEKKLRVFDKIKNLAESLGWDLTTLYLEDETMETFFASFAYYLEGTTITNVSITIDCKDVPCIDGISIRIPIETGYLSQCMVFSYEGYLELERLPNILIDQDNLTMLTNQFTRYLEPHYV